MNVYLYQVQSWTLSEEIKTLNLKENTKELANKNVGAKTP